MINRNSFPPTAVVVVPHADQAVFVNFDFEKGKNMLSWRGFWVTLEGNNIVKLCSLPAFYSDR